MSAFPAARFLIPGGLLILPVLFFNDPAPKPVDAPADNRYIGQKACKNCHAAAEKGDPHGKWAKGPHAGAFETLGGDAAKAAAKEAGIDDPQKSDQCVKCHVTAFGVDKKEIKRGFKEKDGVQCESCHGPGEKHFKARFAAAAAGEGGDGPAKIPSDEIIGSPGVEVCLKCHNKESPTFKPFCLKERMAKIRHLDPRKERSEEEMKKLQEQCYDDCPKCKEGK